MEFAEQVKSSVDIVHVVGEYVRLKRGGANNRFVGLCPFHTEKTPSFNVNGNLQIFKCFGCGEGGDLFSFVMKMEGFTFPEALRAIAERNGIPIPQRRPANDPETQAREAIEAMHEVAAQVFRDNLYGPNGADARNYLAKRGLAQSHAEQFTLGYSDRSGSDLLRRFQKQFSPEHVEASGLVGKRTDGSMYDRFRGRLMFPIHNESGKVIAFGGRALFDGDEPKYLNSPETPIYHKSNVLYNLHRAKQAIRKDDFAVLVEGYMDVIGVFSAGVHNVIASCGTALTPAQVRAIRRHSERIVVNFDPDNAGANATEKYLDMLIEEGMSVRVLALDGDLDPDEYIKNYGAERYGQKLASSPGYFIWMADRARKKFDMRTAEGRMAGFDFLLPAIKRVHDKIERAAIADEVASYLSIERGLVLDEFRRAAVGRQARAQQPAVASVPKSERVLLHSLVIDRSVRDVLVPVLTQSRAVKKFAIQPILNMLCALHESDPDFSFSDLEGRVGEKEKQILTAVLLGDHEDELFSPEQATAYARVLENNDRQIDINETRARIAQAERDGNINEALRLMQELSTLQRG